MSKMHLHEKQSFLLILDIYKSHFEGNTVDLANEMKIKMMFIPPAMTAELQPLDATVFGELKSHGAAQWTAIYLENSKQNFTKVNSSEI
jgi:hypothetical protein